MVLLDNISKTLMLDTYMVQVVAWLLGFLFVSLVSIIVWLAKGVFSKLETISEKQDKNREQISSLEDKLSTVKEDLSSLKDNNNNINIRMSQAETKIALHAQWIRLRGGDIDWNNQ